MDAIFLHQTRLTEFLETLRGFGELHAPTLSEAGVARFVPLDDPSLLRLDYRRTQIPPKKYLIPFREEILHYENGSYRQEPSEAGSIVLFGVHPCDLQGIAYLDLVFQAGRPDPCYAARRAGLTLVGVSCEPDDFCFCNGSLPGAPCDLFLSSCQDGFLLSSSGAKGEAMAEAARPLLAQALPPEPPEPPAPKACPIAPQDPGLRFSDHPLWQRFADTCVSCGACSVCCPTCYCFDLREYPELSGGGARLREWDNCLFASHGEVAGANFRPTRLERFRYRFLHKYCGFSALEGITSCVGCGRCKAVCPVSIDLRELIEGAPSGASR